MPYTDNLTLMYYDSNLVIEAIILLILSIIHEIIGHYVMSSCNGIVMFPLASTCSVLIIYIMSLAIMSSYIVNRELRGSLRHMILHQIQP